MKPLPALPVLAAAALAALAPSRRLFYRRAALTSEPLTPGWIAAVVAVATLVVVRRLHVFDVLALGAETATNLGVDPRRETTNVLALVAVLGAAVLVARQASVNRPRFGFGQWIRYRST